MLHRERKCLCRIALFLLALSFVGIVGASGAASRAPGIAPLSDVGAYEAIFLSINASLEFFPFHQLILEYAPYDFDSRLKVESVTVDEQVVNGTRVVRAEARTESGLLIDAEMEVYPERCIITFSRDGRPEIRVSEWYGIPTDREKAEIGITTMTVQFEFLNFPEKNCMIIAEPVFPDRSGDIRVKYLFVVGSKSITGIICPSCKPDDATVQFVADVSLAVSKLALDTTIMLPALIGALASHDFDMLQEQLAAVRRGLSDPPTGGGEEAMKFPWNTLISAAATVACDLIASVAGTAAGGAANAAIIAAGAVGG